MSRPIMSEQRTAVIGAIFIALGPVSMALYTPAMPELVEVFGADISTIKLTLTVYFAGFTVAQLFCGPLSDALGRRPVTIAFAVLYLLGSLLAFFGSTVEEMLAARVLQGVGASVGVAVARAIVRDQFIGQTSARIMNLMGIMLAAGPALAPTIGGLTLETLGWRAIFAIMVIYGLAVVALTVFAMRETNLDRDRGHISPSRLVNSYMTLLRSSDFMRPCLILGTTLGCIYTLATILPFVLIEHVGLTPTQYGYSMVLQSGAFFLGSVVTRKLLTRYSAEHIVPAGMALIGVAIVAIAVITHTDDSLSLLQVMAPISVFAFGIAIIMPSMTTQALHPFPQFAGAASALMGFLQMGGGFLGSFFAVLVGDPVTGLGLIIPGMGLTALALYFIPRLQTRGAVDEAGD